VGVTEEFGYFVTGFFGGESSCVGIGAATEAGG